MRARTSTENELPSLQRFRLVFGSVAFVSRRQSEGPRRYVVFHESAISVRVGLANGRRVFPRSPPIASMTQLTKLVFAEGSLRRPKSYKLQHRAYIYIYINTQSARRR